MRIVCYFAAADGGHPDCTTEGYDKLWPVMQQSVERQGYELIHLTSETDRPRCKTTIRYPIDPVTVMYSREVAWLAYLESLPDDEQAVLVEPDAVLLRAIPPLASDKDMMLLRRPGRPVPPGFRLAKKSAAPFYRELVRRYNALDLAKKKFHGDVQVQHELLGVQDATSIPERWGPVRIEQRNWLDYTSKLWKKAVAWNFKGNSKTVMWAMADGIQPKLR